MASLVVKRETHGSLSGGMLASTVTRLLFVINNEVKYMNQTRNKLEEHGLAHSGETWREGTAAQRSLSSERTAVAKLAGEVLREIFGYTRLTSGDVFGEAARI